MNVALENLRVSRVVDEKIHITCPKCTKTTQVDFNKNSKLRDKFIVGYKCKCGNTEKIKLEKRDSYRKSIHLTGKIKKAGKTFGVVSIKDLSRSGLRFEANPQTKLQVGDSLEIEFRLDDKNHSLIRQKGIIRNFNEFQYGFEFIKNEYKEYDRRLGFYFFLKGK